MKQFLLFGFDEFYPGGGWSDFISSHDTKEEAIIAIKEHTGNCDYYQIVDTLTDECQEESFWEIRP